MRTKLGGDPSRIVLLVMRAPRLCINLLRQMHPTAGDSAYAFVGPHVQTRINLTCEWSRNRDSVLDPPQHSITDMNGFSSSKSLPFCPHSSGINIAWIPLIKRPLLYHITLLMATQHMTPPVNSRVDVYRHPMFSPVEDGLILLTPRTSTQSKQVNDELKTTCDWWRWSCPPPIKVVFFCLGIGFSVD